MSRIDYIFFGVYGEKLMKFLKEGGSKYDNNNNYNDDWNYVIIIWLFMFFFVVGSFVFCCVLVMFVLVCICDYFDFSFVIFNWKVEEKLR